MQNELVIIGAQTPVPAAIAAAGAPAQKRFVEFFTANIRNRNTRLAYARAVSNFFAWCEQVGLSTLNSVEPVHVAAYIEQLSLTRAAPSVKHGKTPILSPEEARQLFDGIPTDTVVGLRDRALIGVLIYSFARISAALGMRVEDYFPQGKRWWLRLHEKGGKHHEMPVHHTLEEYLDSYVEAAGIGEEKKGPLFRASNGKTGVLSERPLDRGDAFHMIRRRARQAGIETKIGCHAFRATGITIYLSNGGDLEKAQQMAAHESPRTTKMYDRRNDVVSLDEVEKVVFKSARGDFERFKKDFFIIIQYLTRSQATSSSPSRLPVRRFGCRHSQRPVEFRCSAP